MNDSLKKILSDPSGEYRSAPFWGWNDRIQHEELDFQAEEMKAAGMGGFFIHSREGLETPYLSEEWMENVEYSIDKAEKEGLEVWIYDEDKWPSGSAGGMVSCENPREYSAKGLTLEVISPEEAEKQKDKLCEGKEYADGKILGVYTAQIIKNEILKLNSGIVQMPESEESRVLILRREISDISEWYNGFAPTDNLNPEAVRTFIGLTHERYRKRLGHQFGKTVKGFFTDEPNVCDFYSIFTKGRPWVTFSDGLPAYFERKRGYCPVPLFPYLFYDGKGCEKLRHDYWRTVAELFSEAYMKPLYEWCEQQGIELTGHMLYENDLGYQTRVCGAAMPQYKYLHRPGIDILGEQTKEYLTVKQCTSVAHQYGRKHTISETYGCTGWGFSFEGQKWLGDWQFVMGIDRRCQHLAEYSIAGCRKRDYPPVFNYQNTWWKYNRQMENYFGRLSYLSSQGAVIRDVLVISPMSSIWTKCRSQADEDLNKIEMNMGWLDKHITDLNQWGEEYNRLAEILLAAHIDFDFGDEILLNEDGKVHGNVLVLGKASYHIVLVPRVLSLFESTRKLLEKFSEHGGKIIWTGEFPQMEDGSFENGEKVRWDKISGIRKAADYVEAVEILRNELDFTVQIMERNGLEDGKILTMIRKTEEGYMIFAVNNDRKEDHTVTVTFPKEANVVSYYPWEDKYQEITVEKVKSGIRFLAEFTPAESRMWFLNTDKPPAWGKVEFPYIHPHFADPVFVSLGPTAKVRRTMENALILDQCSFSLESEPFSPEMEVWKAQKEIRKRLCMQQIYYNGAPQRYSWINEDKKEGSPFELRFTFEVREDVEGACYAVIEKSRAFQVSLDGLPLTLTDGFYIDHAMNKWLIPNLSQGVHFLNISGIYTQEIELEDIYIIGEFAVDIERKICRERGTLHFGDWTSQGYFHYPGSIIYEFELPCCTDEKKRYILKMGEYRATVTEVRINGKHAGILMGNTKRELDITEWMEKQGNHLEICVTGSPRNLFGPFHQTYTGCSRISWADFRTEGSFYTSEYVLEPYGIMGQIIIYMK